MENFKQFIIWVNYFYTEMSICYQHWVLLLILTICLLYHPQVQSVTAGSGRQLSLENAVIWDAWHCSDVQSSWADSCLHFLLSRKPPPACFCPSCSSSLLASCWKFFPAASVSHFFPCRHLEHHCSAPHLPPETFHWGPWRGNTSTKHGTFLSNIKGFFVLVLFFP